MKDTRMTISQVARQALLEKIFPYDDDLTDYELALAAYKKIATQKPLPNSRSIFGKEIAKMTTFDITLDADDDLIVDDYIKQKHDSISTVAHHSMINMISNDYADSAAYAEAMEEYRKNPISYKFSDVMAEFKSA